MSALGKLARMLGIRDDQAEDALHNERAARLALSRRSFVGVGAALATGAAFGFYKKLDHLPWWDPSKVYLALHTADGSESYGRVAVARDETGWRVDGAEARSAKPINFPQSTGERLVATHFAIFTAGGHVAFDGMIRPPIYVSEGCTPQLKSITISLDEDPEAHGRGVFRSFARAAEPYAR